MFVLSALQLKRVSNLLTIVAIGHSANASPPYAATHVPYGMPGLQLDVGQCSSSRPVPTLPPNEGWQSSAVLQKGCPKKMQRA